MKKQKKYSFRQFVCFILAMLILNVSIDPKDADFILDGAVQFTEDLTLNEVESITEWLIEEGLDIKNAIPEQDEADDEDTIQSLSDFEFQKPHTFNFVVSFSQKELPVSFYRLGESCYNPEIHSPPPQA